MSAEVTHAAPADQPRRGVGRRCSRRSSTSGSRCGTSAPCCPTRPPCCPRTRGSTRPSRASGGSTRRWSSESRDRARAPPAAPAVGAAQEGTVPPPRQRLHARRAHVGDGAPRGASPRSLGRPDSLLQRDAGRDAVDPGARDVPARAPPDPEPTRCLRRRAAVRPRAGAHQRRGPSLHPRRPVGAARAPLPAPGVRARRGRQRGRSVLRSGSARPRCDRRRRTSR